MKKILIIIVTCLTMICLLGCSKDNFFMDIPTQWQSFILDVPLCIKDVQITSTFVKNGDKYTTTSDSKITFTLDKVNNDIIIVSIFAKKRNEKIKSPYINYKYSPSEEFHGVQTSYVNLKNWNKYDIVIPPSVGFVDYLVINLGNGMDIRDISISVHNNLPHSNSTILTSAHLGSIYGFNNLLSFEMSGRLGFRSCVANLRETKDNILVCAHNDNFTDKKGIVHYISELTYDEIEAIGYRTHYSDRELDILGGMSLCTTEQFIQVCKKFKMRPVWSCHQNINWTLLKNLLAKYNYTDDHCILIKSYSQNNIEKAFEVLGELAIYGIDTSVQDNILSVSDISKLLSMNIGSQRLIELDDYSVAIPKSVSTYAKDNNIIVSAVIWNSTDMAIVRNRINEGVSEFTTDCMFNVNMPY